MIRIRDLRMSYRTAQAVQPAVRGLSLDINEGQFYTLLGPSGCGKTTTLRCVAGLERPDSGEISIGGEIVYSSEHNIWVDPYNRNIGMVFQSYAIWPHMTVFDNVAFPLRHKRPRPPRKDIRDQVMRALSLVHLDGLEDRPAPYLSGGQQQRLALARALVAEPRVLLLDEPLSNLDAKLREEMRLELRDVVERLKVTTLFVTHEQIEALTMSDVMAVMKDGVIVQEGPPEQIYGTPDEAFVADFIGKTNMFSGHILTIENEIAHIETDIGTLASRVDTESKTGDHVKLTVRPENVLLAPNAAAINVVSGRVDSIVYLGNLLDCVVAIGEVRIRVQLHPSTALSRGARVQLRLPVEHCRAVRR
jgi:iron(III) transport system ATP-binding protein